MSSFGENFERDENKNMQFDTYAFFPVLESFIILLIFYTSYKLYSLFFKYQVKYQDETTYRNCQCKACKQRLRNLVQRKTKKQNLIFYLGCLCFFILAFSICYKKILETQSKIKGFDPYEPNQQLKRTLKKHIKN